MLLIPLSAALFSLALLPPPSFIPMAPTAADRARKMEMRQEAAAVANANAAAAAAVAAIVDQSDVNRHGADMSETQDAAGVMLSLAMGGQGAETSTGTVGVVGMAPSTTSPMTPKPRAKGKGRASHLGPTLGIDKSRASAAVSPVGVLAMGSTPTSSACATPQAQRPPAYPTASSSAPAYNALQGTTPLHSGVNSNLGRPLAARVARPLAARLSSTTGMDGVEVAPPTATAAPLGVQSATVGGFVVRTTPAANTAAAQNMARRSGAITAASPAVAGVRRRTHRIPAARLARQLESAGATAAAKRIVTDGSDATRHSGGSVNAAVSPSREGGLLSLASADADARCTRPSSVEAWDGAVVEIAGTAHSRGESSGAHGAFVGVPARREAATGAAPGAAVEGPAKPTAGWVEVISTDDLGSVGTAPPRASAAPSVSGSTGGISTPGQSDIESGPPSPSRPLTWRSIRDIPSPAIRIPLATTPPPLPSTPSSSGDQMAAAAGNTGASASPAAALIASAVRASTESLRADVAALSARTNNTLASLQQLKTKVDTSVNLSQQTLVAVRKVESAVKAAVSDVIKKDDSQDKDNAETIEQRDEQLLEEVKVSLPTITVNRFYFLCVGGRPRGCSCGVATSARP